LWGKKKKQGASESLENHERNEWWQNLSSTPIHFILKCTRLEKNMLTRAEACGLQAEVFFARLFDVKAGNSLDRGNQIHAQSVKVIEIAIVNENVTLILICGNMATFCDAVDEKAKVGGVESCEDGVMVILGANHDDCVCHLHWKSLNGQMESEKQMAGELEHARCCGWCWPRGPHGLLGYVQVHQELKNHSNERSPISSCSVGCLNDEVTKPDSASAVSGESGLRASVLAHWASCSQNQTNWRHGSALHVH
jgi:hypothetical protein